MAHPFLKFIKNNTKLLMPMKYENYMKAQIKALGCFELVPDLPVIQVGKVCMFLCYLWRFLDVCTPFTMSWRKGTE